jgi:hypothetical protein
MKTAVEWLMTKLQSLGVTKEEHYELLCQLELEAKEMEKDQKISLLEWIRNNAVEVQGGWQYDGWTYTDKEILEVYYKQCKQH